MKIEAGRQTDREKGVRQTQTEAAREPGRCRERDRDTDKDRDNQR